MSSRRSLDSSSRQRSQRSNLADAIPPPAEPSPEPSPGLLPEPSLELHPGPSPELSPELPQESQPSRHGRGLPVYEDPGATVTSPPKAGSFGGNLSQDSASSRNLSLGTNTSPRKDKGKGKATETAAAEQLKGSSGEISNSPTNILHQPASSTAISSKKAKGPRRPKHSTKPPRGGESSLPQNQEPNQNNDSQETLQGMMTHSVPVCGAHNLYLVFSSTDGPWFRQLWFFFTPVEFESDNF